MTLRTENHKYIFCHVKLIILQFCLLPLTHYLLLCLMLFPTVDIVGSHGIEATGVGIPRATNHDLKMKYDR